MAKGKVLIKTENKLVVTQMNVKKKYLNKYSIYIDYY